MSKDKWSALSAQERAQLINIYVQSGITDLDFIKKDYNSFDEGGSIEEYSVPSPKDDDINVPYRSVITDSMKKDFITKSKNKFDTFVSKMYPIVERSLLDAGYSTDNLNNILRQMAHESNYGLHPRGNGYNLSGIKAWDNKEGTKYSDGYYYKNFNDYKDYADYHVALLNNRYNALDANDTKDFVYKLHHTKDGKKYSADEKGYKKNLNRMYSLDKAIKKYETNSDKGVRILDGSTEENQTLDNTPWYKKVSNRDTWEHRFDGNSDTINGGEIPAVTITPEKWQKEFDEFSKKNPEIRESLDKKWVLPDRRRRSIDMELQFDRDFLEGNMDYDEYEKHYSRQKNRSDRFPVYYDTTSDQIYKRVLDVYKAAGEPRIYIGEGRPYYRERAIGKHSIHNISTINDVITELAHPIEGSGFITTLKDLPKTLKGELTRSYEHYEDPNHYEYRTHKIVEPSLLKYILDGEPTPYIHQFSGNIKADGGPAITDKEYTSIPEEVSEEDTQEYPKSFLENIQKAFERQPTKLLFDSYVDPVEVDQSLISKFSEKGTFKVPNDMPERKFVTYVNSKVKPIEDNTIQELQDLSTDELISLQRDLAAEGAYDINLKEGKSKEAISIQKMLYRRKYLSKDDIDGNIGKHTIRALQQMLVDNHYLKENREDGKSNIDGWLGKRTREAFKQFNRDINIDGEIGDKTITAYRNKNAQKQGFNANVSAEGLEDNCAKWVTKKYDVVTGNRSKQNGVYGNAWTMMKNVEDSGGQMIFNIYDDPIFDNSKNVADSNSLKATTEKILKLKKIDYNSLLPGDIVGIYVPSSSHHSDVLKEGTTYNTHVGIVADVQNGIPIIEHNINGNVRRENINKLTGSKYGKVTATVAVRPAQGEQVKGELEFENIKSEIKYPEKYKNELMDEYTDALASTKKALQDFYTTVDLDFIEKAAIAITKRETNYMTNKMSDQRKNIKNVKNFISSNLRAGIHNIKTPEEKVSQDLNKMKFDSLPKNYRDAIGLYSPEQLSTDPTVTGRATMLLLSKNYEYLVRLAKENPDLNLTKEDIENAVIRSYNVGFKNIETLGFNPDGSININELYYLKNSGRPGVREKSINSTNYKYLGVLGNLIYNISDDNGYVPYVSAARKEIENLEKR